MEVPWSLTASGLLGVRAVQLQDPARKRRLREESCCRMVTFRGHLAHYFCRYQSFQGGKIRKSRQDGLSGGFVVASGSSNGSKDSISPEAHTSSPSNMDFSPCSHVLIESAECVASPHRAPSVCLQMMHSGRQTSARLTGHSVDDLDPGRASAGNGSFSFPHLLSCQTLPPLMGVVNNSSGTSCSSSHGEHSTGSVPGGIFHQWQPSPSSRQGV